MGKYRKVDPRIWNGRIKIKFIGVLLPWVATVVTALPFSIKWSLFLDWLVDLYEN
jgi:hypothetical protein